MNVLLVDDQLANRTLLKALLEEMEFTCFEAEDGEQAVEAYREQQIDLVLMDVEMPVMDGYEATKRLKQLAGERYLPVIFLTAHSDESTTLKCLACGDDVLTKPVNVSVLRSKISAHQRTQSLMHEVVQKSGELEALHETLQNEHVTGQHVLAHALSKNLGENKNIRSHVVAQSTFNGDILFSAQKPMGGVYVFLGDITGHGLAAAIGTIPLSQVFFTMTRKGKPAASIIREMNSSLRAFLPRSMYCAALLLEVSSCGSKMKVWSGGVPLCFHMKNASRQVTEVMSRHLPLGVLEEREFDASLENIELEEGDSILSMTDGIPESVNAKGEMFGFARVSEIVGASAGQAFDRLLEEYEAFVENADQEDDVSLVEVFARDLTPAIESSEQAKTLLPWRTSIVLDASTLKSMPDPVSEILKLIPEQLEFAVYQERIFTVFTELFSNALEHGILGLESSMKSNAEGFANYYMQRAERLANLESAMIEINISFEPRDHEQVLRFEVRDSGDGFDVSKIKSKQSDTNFGSVRDESQNQDSKSIQSHGRGLTLISSLCSVFEYNGQGNEVRVEIPLYERFEHAMKSD